jgi:hypothetical protein
MMIVQENKTMSATKDDVNHLKWLVKFKDHFSHRMLKKTGAEMFHKEKRRGLEQFSKG